MRMAHVARLRFDLIAPNRPPIPGKEGSGDCSRLVPIRW
jgi:hypothetical protein